MSVQLFPGEDDLDFYNRLGHFPFALFLLICDTLNITEPKECLTAQMLCLQFTPETRSTDAAGDSRQVWSDSFSKPHLLEDTASPSAISEVPDWTVVGEVLLGPDGELSASKTCHVPALSSNCD